MAIYRLFLLLLLASCSLQKLALRSSSTLFEKSANGMMYEGNWDFFRESAPANIKFVEVLWLQDKENIDLLPVLTKTYSGYAFSVPETLYFNDAISDVEDSPWKEKAITYYTRSLDYGIRYLKHKGLSSEILLSSAESQLKRSLQMLDDRDISALLYTAQSWGSLINLQKDNVILVSQVPRVKLLFDYACEKRPDFDNNVCDLFFAQYLVSRPKMLGGDPEKGEALYQASMKKHPHNLLIRVSYIQHVILPAYDKVKYEAQAKILRDEFQKWEDFRRESLENPSPYGSQPELNLFNAVAKKRFEIIEKHKHHIF